MRLEDPRDRVQLPSLTSLFPSALPMTRQMQRAYYAAGLLRPLVDQEIVSDQTYSHGTAIPLAEHDLVREDMPLNLPTIKSAENDDNALRRPAKMAPFLTSSSCGLVTVPSHDFTIFEKNGEDLGDEKRPEKWQKESLGSERRREDVFKQKFGSCLECRRARGVCQPAHHGITWEDLDKIYLQSIKSSTEKEFVPSSVANPEQHSYAPFHEGTVADSGYVSACASWPHHEMKPHEQLIDHGIMTQPGGQKGPEYDQQTVYTSMELLHGSECITDLCNDIYLKLKHEIQEHTQDQDRVELPDCLPALIKGLSIRVGLDKSNPASPFVMHFLHVRHK